VNRRTNVSAWPEAYVSHQRCGTVAGVPLQPRVSHQRCGTVAAVLLQPRVSHQTCANARIRSRFLSCSRMALYLICSLRSLRCSLGCRRLRRNCQNGKALFRHLLLQIGGANIEDLRSLA
jgi:hypothetical protein